MSDLLFNIWVGLGAFIICASIVLAGYLKAKGDIFSSDQVIGPALVIAVVWPVAIPIFALGLIIYLPIMGLDYLGRYLATRN